MLRTEQDVFLAICEEAGTLFAYKAGLLLKKGEWKKLASIGVNPRLYTCPDAYLADAQVASFFKKHPGLPLGVDRKEAAIALFWEAERACYRTNSRLRPLLWNPGHYGSHVEDVLVVWKRMIAKVVGAAPSLDSLTDSIKFGPGSTYRNSGSSVPLAHKLMDGYTRTSTTTPVLQFWSETVWGRYASRGLRGVPSELAGTLDWCSLERDGEYAERTFEVVRGNRFTTVPKDAKKDRGICVEASLNVAYQLAIGTLLSKRMKRSFLRWDKSTCADMHKVLARIGSMTRSVATIDLSMASDTVCHSLVELLLPPDWYELVARFRSPATLIGGKWVRLEKFSSMGNGYTFELETLLFFTLAKALEELVGVREDPYTPGLTISVFGDDIIVPTSLASSVIPVLRFFGFTPNEDKTFVEGGFRESCGGDYLNGHDVRPHYQKEELSEPRQLISLANGLSRLNGRARNINPGRLYRRSWFKCLDAIPSNIRRLRGPAELGDLVIADEHWHMHNPMRVRNGIRWLSVWRPVRHRETPWSHFRPGVVATVALWDCRETTPTDLLILPAGGFGHPQLLQAIALEAGRVKNARPDGSPTRVNGSYVSGYKIGRVAWS